MKHNIVVNGYGYRLRPVELNDAQFIIDVRLEDAERNKFIHAISTDVSLQEEWIKKYFEREGDYYFVIENKITKTPEGLISIYDKNEERAEWGRWVVKKGSLSAIESVDLMLKAAFEKIGLKEVYSRTIADNEPVVKFHDSNNEKFRARHKDCFELNGQMYDAIEHYVDKDYYYKEMRDTLETKSQKIYMRNLRFTTGGLNFHHIAVATNDIEKEFLGYKLLGYVREASFVDDTQGVKGQFIVAPDQPRLELLENLPDSKTLTFWLENKIKMYHFAYSVKNFDKAKEVFINSGARVISPPKDSAYFGKRICFLMLPNMYMVELIEES